MKKALRAFYSGRVQGVGFRFTVQRIAERLKVTGWAENLSDGRVEVIAESDEVSLKEFLVQVGNTFSQYIQDVDIDWEPATGAFHDFSIRF